jgi:aspartate 1-decarboxylase
VIIVSYATMDFEAAKKFKPSIAFVDSNNKVAKGKTK